MQAPGECGGQKIFHHHGIFGITLQTVPASRIFIPPLIQQSLMGAPILARGNAHGLFRGRVGVQLQWVVTLKKKKDRKEASTD